MTLHRGWISSLIAVVIGLLFGLAIMLIAKPFAAFQGFFTILGGWLIHGEALRRFGDFLYLSGPLILTGLSVGFAFKTGLFNIGATGQYTMGMYAAIFVGIYGDWFGPFQWVAAFFAAVAFGTLWGLIPGFLKAFYNVHEVIASIMLNYIAMYTVNALIFNDPNLMNLAFSKTKSIDLYAYLPVTFLRDLFPRSAIDIGIVIAVIVAIAIFWVLTKTTFGYELQSVGMNRFASQASGIRERRSLIYSMSIAGALAGAAGALYFLSIGSISSGNQYSVGNELLSAGFDGIAVALLAQSHPIGTIFSALLISFIQRGGYFMQLLGIKGEIIDVIVASIIYASAMAVFVQEFIGKRFKKRKVQS